MYLHATSGTLTAAQIAGYGTKLKTMDGVGAVAPADVSADRATAEYTVTLSSDPQSTTAVNTLKNGLRPQAHGRRRRARTRWSAGRRRCSPTSRPR